MSRKAFLIGFLLVAAIGARAQYNIDRLLTSGQIALSYDDYVLSIQYFNRIIELKPYIYQLGNTGRPPSSISMTSLGLKAMPRKPSVSILS